MNHIQNIEYLKEILTYDLYVRNNILYIEVPVSGLINPQYLLKDNSLYVFLYQYTQAYIVKNIDPDFINYIINGRSYLKESLSYDNCQEHLISLIPS